MCSGSKVAAHIRTIRIVPRIVIVFFIIPKIRKRPIKNNPAMNNMSTVRLPAIALNIPASGPFVPNCKNPRVGEPPLITAASFAVAKPNPNNLSKNAHKKISPRLILVAAKNLSPFFMLWGGWICL